MPATADSSKSQSSVPSSKASSIKSEESRKSPGLSPHDGLVNGAAGPDASQPQRPLEKSSVKERLTRIFYNKEAPKNNVTATNGDHAARPHAPSSANSTGPPPTPRKDNASSDRPLQNPSKAAPGRELGQRFVVNADLPGGHEHFLKSSRRQEKLSDLWRSLLGKKQEAAADGDLSLVSNWVDSLRQEKDEAGEKKLIPNTSSTLVEKYGKCQEIVGRGAFGIVRISHKKLGGSSEKLFAVKEFRRRPEETEKKYSKRLTAEFCISSSLRHPNVIHTLDLLKDAKGDYCEVMEFCAGGDLYTLILK
ncbi:hypothetical protein CDD82_2191 [Ophiocordyceps australis]|uniref:mitogen-activated protein kinase kinase n=1 Tax=Ophiocordyceps australis TaxID=1399860 RepID=A0A2C5Y223_9HYPO|nr:hypothetical protein CDD82_2191 [Ophiocordyceps australis]